MEEAVVETGGFIFCAMGEGKKENDWSVQSSIMLTAFLRQRYIYRINGGKAG